MAKRKEPAWKEFYRINQRLSGAANFYTLLSFAKGFGYSVDDMERILSGDIVPGEKMPAESYKGENAQKEKAIKELVEKRFGEKASSVSQNIPKEFENHALANRYRLLAGGKKGSETTNFYTLLNLGKRFGYSNEDVARVARGDLASGPGFSKEQIEKDAALKTLIDKYFRKDASSIENIPEEFKDHPLSNVYRLLSGMQSTSGLTPEQEEANKSLTGTLTQGTPQDVLTMVGGQRPGAASQQQTPLTTGQVVSQQAKDLLNLIVNKIPEGFGSRGVAVPIPENATPAERKAIEDTNARLSETGGILPVPANATPDEKKAIEAANVETRRRNTIIKQGLGDIGGQTINALQQGPTSIGQFGQPQQEGLLGSYDQLVNLIRPGRTTAQNIASSLSRAAPGIGSSALGGVGNVLFGPLGATAGALLGSGVGYLGQLGLDRFARPAPEFSGISRLLAGDPKGYLFAGGNRGLADFISGQQRTSRFGDMFNFLRPQQDVGRFGRLRQTLGGGVRNFGQFIGQPNRANQLRQVLSIAQALPQLGRDIYGAGEALGINSLLRGAGRKLGLIRNEPMYGQAGMSSGERLAGSVLPSAYQYLVPQLQQQANEALGYNVPAESVVGQLDQRMLGALAPQIVRQNLEQSRIAGKAQRVGVRQRAQKAVGKVAKAAQGVDAQLQAERFQRVQQINALREQEQLANAIVNRQRATLSAEEVAAGMPLQPYPTLQPVGAYGQIPETLEAIGQAVQPISTAATTGLASRAFAPSYSTVKVSEK